MNSFILFVGLIWSLISQAQSLICSSQSFQNRSFPHCEDLPHLNAFLHWTHDPKNSSLSVAFLASPPHAGGWVAWAVNPTSTGMVGAQALIANIFGDSPTIHTFNISSYSSDVPSAALSFPVWDLAAEFSEGRFTIFATVKVPSMAKSLNQVWQVGPAVDPESGSLAVHEFKLANLNAKGMLVFDKESEGASLAPRAHGDASSAPTSMNVGGKETTIIPSPSSPDKAGVARIRSRNLGFAITLLLFIFFVTF